MGRFHEERCTAGHGADTSRRTKLLDEHHASDPADTIGGNTQVFSPSDLLDEVSDHDDKPAGQGPRHGAHKDSSTRIIKQTVIICAIVAVIIAGIYTAVTLVRRNAMEQLAVARQSCEQVQAQVKKKATAYSAYMDQDAQAAQHITAVDVTDSNTVDELTKIVTESVPQQVNCNASSVAQYKTQEDKLGDQLNWYTEHQSSLETAVANVHESHEQKRLNDACTSLASELQNAREVLNVSKDRVDNTEQWNTLSTLVDQADDLKNSDNVTKIADMTERIRQASDAVNEAYQQKLREEEEAAQARQRALEEAQRAAEKKAQEQAAREKQKSQNSKKTQQSEKSNKK